MVQMANVDAAAWLVKNLNGNIPSGMTTPVRVHFSGKGGGQGKASKGGWERASPYDGKGGPPPEPPPPPPAAAPASLPAEVAPPEYFPQHAAEGATAVPPPAPPPAGG